MTAQIERSTINNAKDIHIPIQIDRRPYIANHSPMTGTELKELGGVPDAFDLFLDIHGPSDDQLIADGQSVELKPGMHFFSSPRDLNPGGK